MSLDLTASLKTHFGFDRFRPGQEQAVRSLLAGRHTLVVMPTGAGKSLIYQLAGLTLPGLTLVISPLIALMKDQVDGLERLGLPATYVNSSLDPGEQRLRLAAVAAGEKRLLYIAPERLRSPAFLQSVQRQPVSLLAVDEAHCISEWGHDFRPDYLRIASVRQELGNPLTAALTATATPLVQEDILRLLRLPDADRVVTGFNRPNLTFNVRYTDNPYAKQSALRSLLQSSSCGAIIVYTGTRREAEETAGYLRAALGRPARFYHGGLEAGQRTAVQEAFMDGESSLVVATNAFGMGIDRADVRVVVHFTMPGNLESYYQEAGRAGRDGLSAQAVLLYAPDDRQLHEWFIENGALSFNELYTLHQAIAARGEEEIFVPGDVLSGQTGIPGVKLRVALAELEKAGAVRNLAHQGSRLRIRPGPWQPDRIEAGCARMVSHQSHRRAQLRQMIAYAESGACRRRILLDHFNDPDPGEAADCCDNCRAKKQPTPAPAATRNLSPAQEAGLAVLAAIQSLNRPVGLQKLAQILAGSRAREIRRFGYDRHPHYGRLEHLKQVQIEALARQMVASNLAKITGGKYPVISLSPGGEAALTSQALPAFDWPAGLDNQTAARKKAAQHAGGTLEYTLQLFSQGLSPDEIALYRGLTGGTVSNHLAQLVKRGEIALDEVVSPQVQAQVEAAVQKIGPNQLLRAYKGLLPDEIEYYEIRCVLAARALGDSPPAAPPPPDPPEETPAAGNSAPDERSLKIRMLASEITALGESRSPDALPMLFGALKHTDGNIRRLAVSALGKIGSPKAVAPLMALLGGERDQQVRIQTVIALGKIGDPRATLLLDQISGDSSETDDTRRAAREALASLGNGRDHHTSASARPGENHIPGPQPQLLNGLWDLGWALDRGCRNLDQGLAGGMIPGLVYRLVYQDDRRALVKLVDLAAGFALQQPELFEVDALVSLPEPITNGFDSLWAFTRSLAGRLHRATWRCIDRSDSAGVQVTALVAGKRLLVVDGVLDPAGMADAASELKQAGAACVNLLAWLNAPGPVEPDIPMGPPLESRFPP